MEYVVTMNKCLELNYMCQFQIFIQRKHVKMVQVKFKTIIQFDRGKD